MLIVNVSTSVCVELLFLSEGMYEQEVTDDFMFYKNSYLGRFQKRNHHKDKNNFSAISKHILSIRDDGV